jgi:tetratricopeptide (TPR) repeat protein
MTTETMAAWVARGRAHQGEGRAADALPCFRRAAREDPQSPIPSFHLGEALWQLGLPAEAVAAWHRSARLVRSFVPPRQALSEAALLHGDFASASAMAAEAAAAAPQNERAQAAAAAAAAALHDTAAMQLCARQIGHNPELVQVPALANAYAAALAAVDSAARSALFDALAMRAAMAPPALLATLAERGASIPGDTAERAWIPDDAESLRRIAVAARNLDSELAARLADSYSTLTASRAAPPVPTTRLS